MELLKTTEKRRKPKPKPGGAGRAWLKRREYEEAAKRADEELLIYQVGERPSTFFPGITEQEPVAEEQVVFDSSLVQKVPSEGRKAAVARLRKDEKNKINGLLEKPEDKPVTKRNLNFIERRLEKIRRFAITLRNKKRPLNPRIKEILNV